MSAAAAEVVRPLRREAYVELVLLGVFAGERISLETTCARASTEICRAHADARR